MEGSLCINDRGIVVPHMEVESYVPVSLVPPVQQSVFTAVDDFISAVKQLSEVLSEATTVSNLVGTKRVPHNGDTV